MNEFQLMVFLQKISRGFTTQRDIQFQDKRAAADSLSNYLIERLNKDEAPIYLHEVACYLCIGINTNSWGPANSLRQAFEEKVVAIYEK